MGAVDEVRRLEERLRLGDALPDPDTSAIFEELIDADAWMLAPEGPFDREAVLRGHRPPRKRAFDAVKVTELELRELGDAVAVHARTDFFLEGRAFGFRTFRLWRRARGSWQVAVVVMLPVPKGD